MITQVHRKLGQWSIRLRPDAPAGLLSGLEYFGHVAVVPGRVNPVERGDECLDLARYVGVLRSRNGTNQVTIGGPGLPMWLGDEDGKGEVIETPAVTFTAVTFATAIAGLVPTSVPVGTIYTGVPGTYTGEHTYQSRRTAIDYVCDLMGGEWRVTNRGYLDAGPAADLFRLTPEAVIVRRGSEGYDMGLRALGGDIETTLDAKDYSTRVVVVAQALAGGTADAGVVPYKDLHGNDVQMTRIVDETDDTTSVNAAARAQSILDLYSGPRKSVRLQVVDFDVAGDFTPGDMVWVYDPDNGLSDTANEVSFRGRLLNPTGVRVLSLTWPVTAGYTVAYRGSTGGWTDLTPWVDWESSGGGEVEVADTVSSALTSGIGSIGTTVSGGGGGAGDTAVPDVPTFGTFTTTSYQPGDGLPRAAVKLTWTQPLNTDASTIVDGDHYDIRFRPTGTSDWQLASVSWSQTDTTITNLPPSTGYDWQIRAVDYATPVNEGAWSATTAFATAQDTTAPATPAPATVAASLIAVQVTHTLGLASGGTYNLPLDMDHLEIHVGTSSGFTPSTGSLAGKLAANGAMVTGSIPAVGTFAIDTLVTAGATAYVKVIAVDRTGNRSTASSAASATAQLIDSSHISDLTASKITAGTISAALLLSGSIKTGTSGARVESDANGVRLYNSGGSVVVNLDASTGNATFTGGGTFSGALSAATGTFSGSLSAATGTFSGTISASTITGSTLQTAASGARVLVGSGSGAGYINFYDSSGNNGYIRAGASGGSNEMGMYSGSGSSWVQAHNSNASLNYSGGGVVSATSGGAVCSAAGAGSAQLTCSGSTITVAGSTTNITSTANTNVTASGNVFISASGNQVNCGSSSSDQVYSTGVYNSTSSFTANVGIATSPLARLYRLTSSARYKVDIQPAEIPAEAVLSLQPRTFIDRGQWQQNGESTEGLTRYLGLIAEDVAEVAELSEWLVPRDEEGRPDSVAYDRLGVLLIPIVRDLADRVAALEGAA